MRETDFLIIGSGIAGLTYALKVAQKMRKKKVTIISKADAQESNTKYAQGGVAAVMDLKNDTFKKHIEDTINAGAGLCDPQVAEMVISQGPVMVEDLGSWGVNFDKTPSGAYELGREGGHSRNRVMHHKDLTGLAIETALIAEAEKMDNIEILTHYFAIDLITQHHFGKMLNKESKDVECYGLYALNLKTNKVETVLSKITLLAAGGAGQVYKNTTNPKVATGDGMAMAYRAKGLLEGMEFVQFHPTALYNPGVSPSFLISEAVRGEGAVLRTARGDSFMEKYDKRGSLAPRDITARAVDNEMKKRGDDFVYLDCTNLNLEMFQKKYPSIYQKCKSIGVDIAKEMIPVVPAAHYICGGIRTDMQGRTSIKNLYACGECASTGLHGANRLASNSLLEALVFANACFLQSVKDVQKAQLNKNVPEWSAEGTSEPIELVLITHNLEELKAVMSNYVGIVRSDIRLKRALGRLKILFDETEELYENSIVSPQLCELRNLICIGYIILKFCMMRKECVGAHYNVDYLNGKMGIA